MSEMHDDDSTQAPSQETGATPRIERRTIVFDSPERIEVRHEDNLTANFEYFGNERLFRPRFGTSIDVIREFDAHLRSRYEPGEYNEPSEIKAIIDHIFTFYSNLLSSNLPHVASRDVMDFVLHQYDVSCEIRRSAERGELSASELDEWRSMSGRFRRALKYLAERIALLAPAEAPSVPRERFLHYLDRVWKGAEELVDLYQMSELLHSVFPENAALLVCPEGDEFIFRMRINDDIHQDMGRRISESSHAKIRYPGRHPFEYDIDNYDSLLSGSFRDRVGMGFREIIQMINELNASVETFKESFHIPFVNREQVVRNLSNALGHDESSVDLALSGFTIAKEAMEKEGRVIWKPKQEYRAYRRAYFSFPHPTGQHLTWSKGMLIECLGFLSSELAFQQLAPEWRSPDVDKAVAKISNEAGGWFESVVHLNIDDLGLRARSYKKQIGVGSTALKIPHEIGDLDCLATSADEQLLVLAECKMVRSGTEPAFFRGDISKFTAGDDAYFLQARRKARWVRQNFSAVLSAVAEAHDDESVLGIERFSVLIITYFPSIASYFDESITCVSLAELLREYESAGKWPYPAESIQ